MSIHYSATSRGFFDSSLHAVLPDDAKEISGERHRELLDAQAQGKRIVPGDDGLPVAQDAPPPTAADVARVVLTRRNARLSASDWTQMPDVPLGDELRAAWVTYRQALRDLTKQPGFPFSVAWPQEPSSAASAD